MNQAELIAEIATNSGQTKTAVEGVLKALGGVACSELGGGGEIVLPGIGKLSVVTRAARNGRNPSTGEALAISEKKVPKFSAAKALKDAVAG